MLKGARRIDRIVWDKRIENVLGRSLWCVHLLGRLHCFIVLGGTKHKVVLRKNSKIDTAQTFLNPAGSIPRELGALSELKQLDLSGNEFTGEICQARITTTTSGFEMFHTDTCLSRLSRSRVLRSRPKPAFALPLAGPIPGNLGALSKLKELVLYNNKLTGERG